MRSIGYSRILRLTSGSRFPSDRIESSLSLNASQFPRFLPREPLVLLRLNSNTAQHLQQLDSLLDFGDEKFSTRFDSEKVRQSAESRSFHFGNWRVKNWVLIIFRTGCNVAREGRPAKVTSTAQVTRSGRGQPTPSVSS